MAWIGADGAAAAIRIDDRAILMRPNDKLFGAQLWANRRGLKIAAEGLPLRNAHFDCVRTACRSNASDRPRLSVWWTIRKPKPADLEAFCQASDILVMKADVALPDSCTGVTVLRPGDFAANGALEIYPAGRNWRLEWAQPIRGDRPWTHVGGLDL